MKNNSRYEIKRGELINKIEKTKTKIDEMIKYIPSWSKDMRIELIKQINDKRIQLSLLETKLKVMDKLHNFKIEITKIGDKVFK